MFKFWKKKKDKKEKKKNKKNKKHDDVIVETAVDENYLDDQQMDENINFEQSNEFEAPIDNNFQQFENNETVNEPIVEEPKKESLLDKEITINDTSDLTFSQEEIISNNLFQDTLYTEQDLRELNLTDKEVIKFFKNGSTYYKLKDPLNDLDKPKKIFKNNTKFSLKTLGDVVDKDPYFDDVKHYKKFDFEGILTVDKDVDMEKHKEMFRLNKTIEKQLKDIESYLLDESEIDSITEMQKQILENQKIMQKKIYNLKEEFANSEVFYRVQNLEFNTWNEDDIYFGYKLNKVSFDIYSGDRIVILSDNSITNQLLIDVLRGDEIKTGGYIYKNINRMQRWVDIDDPGYIEYKNQAKDLNEEVYYGLMSPDYLSFESKKKDNVAITMQRIFTTLKSDVDEDFKKELIRLMKFEDFMTKNVFELDDLNLEKFITICDILIGKKILLIKSICQGMAHNDKIELLRFLNKYFDSKKITVLYASDDFLEANVVSTKIMILKDGYLVDYKKADNILKSYNTINEFILYTLKYGVVPSNMEE